MVRWDLAVGFSHFSILLFRQKTTAFQQEKTIEAMRHTSAKYKTGYILLTTKNNPPFLAVVLFARTKVERTYMCRTAENVTEIFTKSRLSGKIDEILHKFQEGGQMF